MELLDEREVHELAASYAGGLAALGCATGDAVAVCEENTARFVAARDATAALGLRLVPLHPRLAPPEIAHALATAWARVLVSDREIIAPPTRTIGFEALARLAAPRSIARPVGPGATILFTSGTTGRAKGCLRDESAETARIAEITRTYRISADDVHLIACPLPHSAPGAFLRAARGAGARTVLLPRFEPEAFLRAVATHRATLSFLVPTQVARLLALPRGAADWSSVRAIVVAGAPFAPATKSAFLDWLGPGRLWEFYGSSEAGTITVAAPATQPGEPGFVGYPPAGVEIRLEHVDARGVGQIFVRSPSVMRGYLGPDPGEWRDGFFGTGDLGRHDGRGGLVLVDRMNDTIITGGVNVYPAEVERALAEHPGVRGAVVVGAPHPEWGEEVCAVVVADVPEADLRAFLRERIAPFKIPKRFRFVDLADLPTGPSGKPIRRAARPWFTD
jgi:acyl-CoA synthetase (AMP-forming)/AMP-acid ligase II